MYKLYHRNLHVTVVHIYYLLKHKSRPSTSSGRLLCCTISCCYFAFPRILNIFVPQTGQVPFAAFMPFFIVVSSGLTISRFVLHFMHLAWIFPSIRCVLESNTIGTFTVYHEQHSLYAHSIFCLCSYKNPPFSLLPYTVSSISAKAGRHLKAASEISAKA